MGRAASMHCLTATVATIVRAGSRVRIVAGHGAICSLERATPRLVLQTAADTDPIREGFSSRRNSQP